MFGLWTGWSWGSKTLGKLAKPNNFSRTIEMSNKVLTNLNYKSQSSKIKTRIETL